MLKIFGCPIHVGVNEKGIGLMGSLDHFQKQYPQFDFPIVSEIIKEEEEIPGLRFLNSVIATNEAIAQYSDKIFKAGDMPLFVGGDHSSLIGTVSAASVNTENLGMIYIDAHPDINTEETTVTGNIHGLPVASLLGMGDKRLTTILSEDVKLKPENIVMIGLRSIDPPERVFLDELHIKYYTYEEVERVGLSNCIDESIAYLKHLEGIHISFDLDGMDPQIIPGVTVPVKKGFTKEDIFALFTAFIDQLPVGSIDVVEYNSTFDRDEVTGQFLATYLKFIKDKVANK